MLTVTVQDHCLICGYPAYQVAYSGGPTPLARARCPGCRTAWSTIVYLPAIWHEDRCIDQMTERGDHPLKQVVAVEVILRVLYGVTSDQVQVFCRLIDALNYSRRGSSSTGDET